jgi:hypothetical protein
MFDLLYLVRRSVVAEECDMNRVTTSVIALVALAIALTSSIAEAADGVPIVQRSTASFELTSATCSHLPSGTILKGTGSQISVTIERTNRTGVQTIQNSTNATGTATDQNGRRYVFHYSNQFRISNTVAQPEVFSGSMNDLFVLGGAGPARLHNGFVADLTTDAAFSSVSSWNVRHAFGDPISFEPGPFVAHCDPL